MRRSSVLRWLLWVGGCLAERCGICGMVAGFEGMGDRAHAVPGATARWPAPPRALLQPPIRRSA